VTTSNNKIDFKEDAMGPELTAEIAPGRYPLEQLVAEIAAEMSSVGSNTYSADYASSSGLWSISSDGSYLDLLFETGSHTAQTFAQVIGFPVLDYTGSISYTGSHLAIHTEEGIVIDLAVTSPVDSFALVFDPLRDPVFTQEAVLTLQASATNSWTGSLPVNVTLAIDYNSNCVTHFFSTTQNYRYWRLKIEDPHNPNLYVEIPKLILSKSTQLSQGPEMGFKNQLDDTTKEVQTPYGHKYFDVYPIVRTEDFTFAFLPEADVQVLEAIYRKVGNSIPIGISVDSSEELFDKDRMFLYCRIKGTQSQSQKFTQYFDVNLAVEEAL
jgi:hypothetical protein